VSPGKAERLTAHADVRCGGAESYRPSAGRGILVRGAQLRDPSGRVRRVGQGTHPAGRNGHHDRCRPSETPPEGRRNLPKQAALVDASASNASTRAAWTLPRAGETT
jgi:hypothetical protein